MVECIDQYSSWIFTPTPRPCSPVFSAVVGWISPRFQLPAEVCVCPNTGQHVVRFECGLTAGGTHLEEGEKDFIEGTRPAFFLWKFSLEGIFRECEGGCVLFGGLLLVSTR